MTATRERKPVVYFHCPAPERAVFYRIVEPSRKLQQQGFTTHLFEVPREEYLTDGDVFVFYKFPGPVLQDWCSRLRAKGKRVVFDLDEMLLALPPYHPAFSQFLGDSEPLRTLKAILRDAATVTVPSAYMATALEKYSANVAVVPFLMTSSLVRERDPTAKQRWGIPEDSVVLGWSGTEGQFEDLLLVKTIIEEAARSFEQVMLVTIGFDAPFLTLPPERKRVFMPNRLSEYLDVLDVVDIGLLPQRENMFNRCGGSLEMLEYGMKAIPVVASQVLPYEEAAEAGASLLLAGTRAEWQERVSTLVGAEEEKRSCGDGLRDYVARNHSLDNSLDLIANVLAS